MKYFIWTLANTPQIWHGKPVDGQGKAKPTLACIELDDGDKRTIENLKLEYPCPIEAEK